MANNKEYVVIKEGKQLKVFKTLNSAKKLAETEGGTVLCNGECVYKPENIQDETISEQVESETMTVSEQAESVPVTEDAPVSESLEKQDKLPEEVKIKNATETDKVKNEDIQKYRLKAFMNMRKKPSLNGPRIGTKDAGSVVDVISVEHDWLQLEDGSFIFYNGGKYAEKL